MPNSYTLHYSDPTNTGTIEVLGTTLGPGKNNYSTSLDLVGPGYPNYGLDTAQNFLKLLENFSGPNPPPNSTTGQLWYDTSNPARSVLRVNNGEVTSNRWPAAGGIYQQNYDPALGYTPEIPAGEVWVDTAANQLKIRTAYGWTVVGPTVDTGPNKTGSEAKTIESNTNTNFPVILNWVNGKVVEIVSYDSFTPKTVIDGFTSLKAGTNLTSKIPARYNGIAEQAAGLYISPGVTIKSTDVLKNRSTGVPQVHTGTFYVEAISGLYVRNPVVNRSMRVYSTNTEGFAMYANPGSVSNESFMRVGIGDANDSKSYIKFKSDGTVGVNNPNPVETFDVIGTGQFTGNLKVTSTSTNALSVSGGATFNKLVSVNALNVSSTSTLVGKTIVGSPTGNGTAIEPANHDTYDIGTAASAFRHLYVSNIGSTGTHLRIYGSVSTATQLQIAREFSIQGQLATTAPVSFDGNANVALDVAATATLITGQTVTTTTAGTQNLLVYNTAAADGLRQISKTNFLADVYALVYQPGMLVPYTTSTALTGFLVCDGAPYNQVTYPSLYAVVGTRYGDNGPGTFRVPNMTGVTTAVGSRPMYYLIKT